MVFSSMTFLFAFLPVVVLVYMLSPKQMKSNSFNRKFILLCMGRTEKYSSHAFKYRYQLCFWTHYRSRQSITVKNACLELGFCSFLECADAWYFQVCIRDLADTSCNAAVTHSSCKDCTSDWYFILYISGDFLSGRCVSRNDKGTE